MLNVSVVRREKPVHPKRMATVQAVVVIVQNKIKGDVENLNITFFVFLT